MSAIEERVKAASVGSFVVIGLVLAGIYWQAYYDDGAPLDAQIQTVQQELNKVNGQLSETKGFLADRAKFQEQLAEVTEEYEKALAYLPSNFHSQDLLNILAKQARSTGVSLISVKPGNPEVKGFYEEMKMDIELEGSFNEMVSYILQLSSSEPGKAARIINVSNVEINLKDLADTIPVLGMKGTFLSYRYLEGK